jgi:hypothetical protein
VPLFCLDSTAGVWVTVTAHGPFATIDAAAAPGGYYVPVGKDATRRLLRAGTASSAPQVDFKFQ